MIDNGNTFIRQLGLIDPANLTMPIAVIGAGGIGSWTTLGLLKLGCSNVTVYDFDNVEEQNLGSQIYTETDIGSSKVEALQRKLSTLVDGRRAHVENYRIQDTTLPLADIFILAVDNIDTRKDVYNTLKGTDAVLIDGRMAGNAIEIYTVKLNDPDSCRQYEKTFFDASEALPIPCSMRSVIYNTFIISGYITDIVSQIANGLTSPNEIIIDLLNFTLYT